jgi:hypothetical protein
MKIEQSPVVKQLEKNPRALQEFFYRLLKRAPETAEDTVTLQDKVYTIRRSPPVTKEVQE